MKYSLLFLLSSLFFFSCSAPEAPKEKKLHSIEDALNITSSHQRVLGTKIYLVPPPGFVPAASFSGFKQDATESSIVVMEIPGPYERVSKGFSPENLKDRQMELIDSQNGVYGNMSGVMLTVRQPDQGRTLKKYILLFGDESRTIMVNGIFDETNKQVESHIKISMESVTYNPEAKMAKDEGLAFTIDDKDSGFQLTKSISGTAIYTIDGKIPTDDPYRSNLIVSPSILQIEEKDRAAFAVERLKTIPTIKEARTTKTAPINIDGLDGFETFSDAKDTNSGAKVSVYQLTLFTKNQYYLLVGTTEGDFEKNIAAFKKLAHTFKLKKR